MKRREFLAATAGLTGTMLPLLTRADSKPCPPDTLQATGGAAINTPCKQSVIGSAAPAWLRDANPAVQEWIKLPKISSAATILPTHPQAGGVTAVTDAWGNAALRENGSYYILHGGGHGDYGGNEIYGISLAADDPKWELLWSGTPYALWTPGTEYYSGNQAWPASYHSGGSLVFDQSTDRLYRMIGGAWVAPSGFNDNIDYWQWGANSWKRAGDNPLGAAPFLPSVATSTGRIHCWDAARRGIFNPQAGAWDYVSADQKTQNAGALVFDSARNAIWSVGGLYGSSASGVTKLDIATNVVAESVITGDSSALSIIKSQNAFGAEYDPVNDYIWVFTRDSELIKIDLGMAAVSITAQTGAVPPQLSDGPSPVYGPYARFKYVRSLKGIVYQPAWADYLYFMRTS